MSISSYHLGNISIIWYQIKLDFLIYSENIYWTSVITYSDIYCQTLKTIYYKVEQVTDYGSYDEILISEFVKEEVLARKTYLRYSYPGKSTCNYECCIYLSHIHIRNWLWSSLMEKKLFCTIFRILSTSVLLNWISFSTTVSLSCFVQHYWK